MLFLFDPIVKDSFIKFHILVVICILIENIVLILQPSALYSCCYSGAQFCLTLCNSMDCSTLGFPIHYQLPELNQPHVQHVNDTILPSHPLLSSYPSASSLSQIQSFLQRVSSFHLLVKVLEVQLHHQSFQ